jgi:hypothetical protein
MLVAYRLAGLSALEAYYASVGQRAIRADAALPTTFRAFRPSGGLSQASAACPRPGE